MLIIITSIKTVSAIKSASNVLTTVSNPKTPAFDSNNIILLYKQILYIYYLIRFKKDQAKI